MEEEEENRSDGVEKGKRGGWRAREKTGYGVTEDEWRKEEEEKEELE